MPRYPALFIDTLAITLPLGEQRGREVHEAVIESHHHHWADYISPGRFAIRGYRGNYEFVTPKGSKAKLFLQPTKPRNNEFRLEYSPNNFGDDGRALLGDYLRDILGAGYLEDILNAKLTRLDVAFDVPRIRLKDLLIVDLRGSKSSIIRGIEGEPESYYFPYDSTNQILVYDKLQETIEREGLSTAGHVRARRVRFEYRYSKMKNYTLDTVVGRMQSPYKHFDVRRFVPTEARVPNERQRIFFDACRLSGVDSVLNEIPDIATRQRLLTNYRAFPTPEFWKRRTSIWGGLRNAIENALPR